MAARRNTRKQQKGSLPWGPMLLSFAVGAFVMFLMHLKDNVPEDKASKQQTPRSESRGIQPTFDFYTLLPETEVVVQQPRQSQQPIVTSPPEAAAEAPAEPVSGPATAAIPAEAQISYMIQVGSFRKLEDADAFRARLAFLGIESKVQTVTIDNQDTWHRVQIGPIVGRDSADAMQKRLQDNQIESLLMRAKHS
ncbi:SPOR domain-containing protein [Methylophaga lonarensis]|uniref:SPOR domain-containing protein n=1 Tax=Methylophaga lonarensis TaxID=999151 RepID=UPI003D2E6247